VVVILERVVTSKPALIRERISLRLTKEQRAEASRAEVALIDGRPPRWPTAHRRNVLELVIKPDIGGGVARASLKNLRLS
jgi:hypothetical protein